MTARPFLLGIVALYLVYLLRLRTARRDRVLYLAVAALAGILIVRPELTQWLASALGIGRGADLVFYLFMLASLFVVAGLLARVRTLERALTAVARSVAISQAEPPTVPRQATGE